MFEALYHELKTMKQAPFKKKILHKLCNAISLVMACSNQGTCLEIVKRQHETIKRGKTEMAYLLFTAQNGKL